MNKEIRVWDPMLRVFHWSLALTFMVSYLSGEEDSIIHIYTGYAVLGLILFRVVWGIIGGKHSRFKDFLTSPRGVFEYLKGLIAKKPSHYLGHNPAGGWMVIALLVSLLIVTVSGLKVYALEQGKGPLAFVTAELSGDGKAYDERDEKDQAQYSDQDRHEQQEEFWEEIHEFFANLTLFLVGLHIAGVVVSSRLHHENLVKAMITGKKKIVN